MKHLSLVKVKAEIGQCGVGTGEEEQQYGCTSLSAQDRY